MAIREAEPDPVAWVQSRWAERELPQPERFAVAASLMRAHAIVVARIEEALREHELGLTAYLMLVTLGLSDGDGRSLSYLARYLLVHQTTVTQMVDRCEQRGLVKRTPHPTDRRTTLVALTRHGRTLLRRATADAAAAGFGLDEVGDARLPALRDALNELRAVQHDMPD
jgi:DNA-binding MarR family transcriptional regulator